MSKRTPIGKLDWEDLIHQDQNLDWNGNNCIEKNIFEKLNEIIERINQLQ